MTETDDARFATQPHHLADGAIGRGWGFFGMGRLIPVDWGRAVGGIPGNKGPAPCVRAEKTLRAQFSIGIYHADTADVKLAGQVTAGRETRPGGEIAAFDLHPNMPDQLTIDRLFAIAIQGN